MQLLLKGHCHLTEVSEVQSNMKIESGVIVSLE